MFAVASVLVIAGVAAAASAITSNIYTDAQGAYHGCVNDKYGNVRVLLPGQACKANEVAIDWNQRGPTGPAGADGTDGTNGTDGTDGTDGTNGVSVTSAAEPAGANCANGGSSFTAANGVAYACNGALGATGPTGPAGAVGPAATSISGYEHVSANVSFPPNDMVSRTVSCPAGKKVIGGGATINATVNHAVRLLGSYPNTDTKWETFVWNSSANKLNRTRLRDLRERQLIDAGLRWACQGWTI